MNKIIPDIIEDSMDTRIKMDADLFDVLKQLALTVKKTIDEDISNGTIQPEEEVYLKWKVDKFQYTDTGITDYGSHSEYITKPSWFKATHKIQESIQNSKEFCSALEELNSIFGKSDTLSHNLEKFVGRFIHQCLYNSRFEEIEIDIVIATFLKDLREEPVKYGTRVELEGIVLQPERIEIAEGITLRQPHIEDLEKEFPEHSFMISRFMPPPSAILNIEFLGRHVNEIQRRVGQAIAILRLFKVGSAKYSTYNIYSDSMTDIMAMGTLSSHDISAALETSLITLEDAPKLKNFWLKMSNSIPNSFYDIGITKADYTTIAYNRYSDGLLQSGILERRIANAIMGLEALYFKPEGEMQELAYRLRIRISKLLGLLGYDPHEIKERINDAYGIRSIFMHGGHLDYRKKRKLDSKYKDVKTLLLSVLDYLRISIILNMLILKEKEEFIDLIDDSLIDRIKEEQLILVISGMKEFIR
ncbi:MAG: HEPN domain-containing protein [Candidatus Methanoperedens sp.]|nr:HEPN domain-containing protein [Candidatus Methanoperedens sp.]